MEKPLAIFDIDETLLKDIQKNTFQLRVKHSKV